MRFKENLQNPERLVTVLDQFRDYDFGEFKAEKIELVYNDWYQRKKNTIHLHNFLLK